VAGGARLALSGPLLRVRQAGTERAKAAIKRARHIRLVLLLGLVLFIELMGLSVAWLLLAVATWRHLEHSLLALPHQAEHFLLGAAAAVVAGVGSV
jgi:hypothetical protein